MVYAQSYQRVDVCFVLDTTGSMSAAINTAKEKVWFIANEIARSKAKPQLRLCLMAYRDREDDYVTRLATLTGNIDAIHAQLKSLDAGGGGTSERRPTVRVREDWEVVGGRFGGGRGAVGCPWLSLWPCLSRSGPVWPSLV